MTADRLIQLVLNQFDPDLTNEWRSAIERLIDSRIVSQEDIEKDNLREIQVDRRLAQLRDYLKP